MARVTISDRVDWQSSLMFLAAEKTEDFVDRREHCDLTCLRRGVQRVHKTGALSPSLFTDMPAREEAYHQGGFRGTPTDQARLFQIVLSLAAVVANLVWDRLRVVDVSPDELKVGR
jgi:hypothetical protein